MARREFQDPGLLTREGKQGREYYLRYRVKELVFRGGAPTLVRKQKWHRIGLCAEMTRREAERERARILAEVNGQVYNIQSQMPVGEFIKLYRQAYLPTLAIPSQATYEQLLRSYIEPAFGQQRLCDVKVPEVQAFLTGLPLAATTKATVRGVLASLWRCAKEWGYWTGPSPVGAIRRAAGQPRFKWEKVLLTPQQLAVLLDAVNPNVQLIIKTLVSTGMRISECLGLRWKNVDLAIGVVAVAERQCRGDVGRPKSETSRRALPLGRLVEDYRERVLAVQDAAPESLVFRKPDGGPYIDNELLANYLTPILKKLGFKRPGMGWHMFRRMHLTAFSQVGATDFEVMHQAGHSSLAVTKDYVLGDIVRRQAATEKVQAVLLGEIRGGYASQGVVN